MTLHNRGQQHPSKDSRQGFVLNRDHRALLALVVLTAIVTLAGTPRSALANPPDSSEFAACRAELLEHFGDNCEFQLVSKRRFAKGMRLKVAVKREMAELKVQFVTCRVEKGKGGNLEVAIDPP